MPITLGASIASFRSVRFLNTAIGEASRASERLSSGLRINRASDDAAGLSISSALTNNAKVFAQGVRNYNDGISALNIASGAADALKEILVRIQELAQQASNGVYSASQRQPLNAEAQVLVFEHNRIIETTQFNGVYLFSQSAGSLELQGGYSTLIARLTSQEIVGAGTFQAAISFGPANRVSLTELADIDNDLKLDIIARSFSAGSVQVFRNRGDGTFAAGVSYVVGGGAAASGLSVGDINGDGIIDIAASDQADTNLSILLGNGDGTFRQGSNPTLHGAGTAGLALADFNGDGSLDVAASGVGGGGAVRILLNNGNGTFAPGQIANFTSYFGNGGRLTVGDFNNDGNPDFAEQRSLSLAIYLGSPSGTLSQSTLIAGGGVAVETGDFNGDGNLDLIRGGNFGDSYANVYFGNGNGTFGAATTVSTGSGPRQIEVVDIDWDGKKDLVVAEYDDVSFSLLRGNGDGTFRTRVSFNAGTTATDTLAVGDVNQDGALDLVGSSFGTPNLEVLLGNNTTRQVALSARKLEGVDLSSLRGARDARQIIDRQFGFVLRLTSSIGASISRIDAANSVLSASVLTTTEAAERIRSADVAEETAHVLRRTIIKQAAAAVLAQANRQPEISLVLLR